MLFVRMAVDAIEGAGDKLRTFADSPHQGRSGNTVGQLPVVQVMADGVDQGLNPARQVLLGLAAAGQQVEDVASRAEEVEPGWTALRQVVVETQGFAAAVARN